MNSPSERRLEPRLASGVRGLVIAAGFEMPCLIVDQSASGLKVRLDRALALRGTVTVIDIAQGAAKEADVAWSKGLEAGLKLRSEASLRGLVPARLAPVREAWRRAGGR